MMRRSSCIETYAPFLAHHFAHIVIIYNSPISVSLRKSITFMIDMPSVFKIGRAHV